jgi:hypothetical protein
LEDLSAEPLRDTDWYASSVNYHAPKKDIPRA